MTAVAEVAPNAKVPITDGHRRVAFAFLTMLRELEIRDTESVDVVTSLIAQQFEVDPAGVGGQFDTGADLVALVGTADSRVRPEDADKFKEFLEIITKKGYFKGAEEGTPEHEQRMKKAIEKFNARNNPFEGLSADQLKDKGNEFMRSSNHKEAVKFYTKAIELSPQNHIFYANRAAAHTHLKDYRSAIIDCEKSISLNDRYSKSYSRLGTALFYEGSYERAVDAYTKASELDPENKDYQADLAQAKEKLSQKVATTAPMGGLGGMPGMPGMEQMMQMMNNPQFLQMTQQMMSNPQYSSLISNMAQSMGRTAPSMQEMNSFIENMKNGRGAAGVPADASGRVQTPFGMVNQQALAQMQEEEFANNPRFREIAEDVRANGMSAFAKYMGDPEVMQMMTRFTSMIEPTSTATDSTSP